jgi:hypothetical protein
VVAVSLKNNIATATGTYAKSKIVTAEASASVEIRRPAIALAKVAEPTQVYEGDTVTYTYSVTNPGNVPLSAVSVTDDKAGDAAYQKGDTDEDGELDTDETWVYTATYVVSADDGSPLVNIATATGTDAQSKVVTAEATVSIEILRPLARIGIQIDTSMGASVYIWDDTDGKWAIDEDTQNPVDGTHHTTPGSITVAAGHFYYIWVEKAGSIFIVKLYPNEWSVTPAPQGGGEAAYGYAAEDGVYRVHFTVG